MLLPTGKLNDPTPIQNNHSLRVSEVVEVNSPPNSTMRNCMTKVKNMIPRKIEFVKKPSKTFHSFFFLKKKIKFI